jgi:hypothetical protein
MGCNTKTRKIIARIRKEKVFLHPLMDPPKEDKPGKCPTYGLDPNQKKIIQLLMKLP